MRKSVLSGIIFSFGLAASLAGLVANTRISVMVYYGGCLVINSVGYCVSAYELGKN